MTRPLLLTALSTTLLAACGGGDDAPATPPPEPIVLTSGLWGKVTATHVGILRPGTYTLSGCQDGATGATLQRKLRLGADGRMELLDAANADAVLLSLVPNNTEHQNRSASVQRNGSADTANSYGISHQRIRYTPGFTYGGALQVNGKGNTLTQVSVQRDNSTSPSLGDETCLVRANGAPVATIEMVFSTAFAREKLASLVALNGAPITASPYPWFAARYESVAIAADGEVTTQTASGAPLTPWGTNWVENFSADKGQWYESWNSSNDPTLERNTPANPSVQVQFQHASLLIDYAGFGPVAQAVTLRRNTDGSGAPVQLFSGNL
jgi:hypothetical protein